MFIKVAVSSFNIVLIQIYMQPELYMISLTGFTASLLSGIKAPPYRNHSTDFRSKSTGFPVMKHSTYVELSLTCSPRIQYNKKILSSYFSARIWQLIKWWVIFNPFVPNGLFLYPLKTSENRKIFWCFPGVEKGFVGNKWVNTYFKVAWKRCRLKFSYSTDALRQSGNEMLNYNSFCFSVYLF